jgi:hypothetical protein
VEGQDLGCCSGRQDLGSGGVDEWSAVKVTAASQSSVTSVAPAAFIDKKWMGVYATSDHSSSSFDGSDQLSLSINRGDFDCRSGV